MKMPDRLHHEELTPEARTADDGELIFSSESHEWLGEAVKRWNLHMDLVEALKNIVETKDKCLLGDSDRGGAIGDNRSEHNEGYQAGSYAAFNQAAQIAEDALAKIDKEAAID